MVVIKKVRELLGMKMGIFDLFLMKEIFFIQPIMEYWACIMFMQNVICSKILFMTHILLTNLEHLKKTREMNQKSRM